MGTPDQLAAWLTERELAPAGLAVDADLHRRALDIREGIRALGRANNEEPLELEQVAAMNAAAESHPVSVQLASGGWSLEPTGGGAEAFIGRVLGAVARSMADDTWSRVKACRNDTCRWLFFDRSRNRSGTWCTMAVCGSRLKARAYRARRREAAGA